MATATGTGSTATSPTMSCASSDASTSATESDAATVAPPRSTVASSQKDTTSSSLCEMKITERPSATMRRRTSPSSTASCGVSTAVGSSRIKTLASRHSALRISTRWRSPIESCQTGRAGSASKPKRAAKSATDASIPPWSMIRGAAPRTTFSATVKVGTRRNSWWTMPTPAAIASAGEENDISCPPRRTAPSSGRYTPARQFMSVVFPAPFSPRTACTVPGRTVRFAPELAITPGNRFQMPSSSTAGTVTLRQNR